MNKCRSCGAEIVWAVMPSGKRMPLDAAPQEPAAKLVMFEDGEGMVVSDDLMENGTAVDQRARGVTFHTSHFATCPNAQRHRR